MIRTYIASPYTLGDQAANVKVQIDCANNLMDLGYCPFAPLLSHFHHLHYPRSYDSWLMWGHEWVLTCDVLLRLPGKSPGADLEVKLAIKHNIPVVYSISELVDKFPV